MAHLNSLYLPDGCMRTHAAIACWNHKDCVLQQCCLQIGAFVLLFCKAV